MSASPSASHASLVASQFGPRARAYVDSKDHATGADLERLAVLARTRTDGRFLDLGCGGGHAGFAIAPHAREMVAYDLSEAMLDAVRAEAAARGLAMIRTERGTAEALPFEDESFDLVVTRFSAHHWFDLAAGLAEMRRVLKPTGLAMVIDTVSPGAPLLDGFLHGLEQLRDPSHIQNYTPSDWDDALRRAGFHPAAPTMGRLRLGFAGWIARIGTPEAEARAIRSLQAQAPTPVRDHFAIEPDGSFTIDTMMIEAGSSA